jgi:hypothetical protein
MLNARAEQLNGMISQIKQVQQWVAQREATLARFEGVWRSARQLHLQQQQTPPSPEPGMSLRDESSLQGHVDALRRLDRELQTDLSATHGETDKRPDVYLLNHPSLPLPLSLSLFRRLAAVDDEGKRRPLFFLLLLCAALVSQAVLLSPAGPAPASRRLILEQGSCRPRLFLLFGGLCE